MTDTIQEIPELADIHAKIKLLRQQETANHSIAEIKRRCETALAPNDYNRVHRYLSFTLPSND